MIKRTYHNLVSYVCTAVIVALCSTYAHSQTIQLNRVDINSAADDFASSLTMNNRYLFMTSEQSGQQQLYVAERSSTGWRSPEALEGSVNSGTMVGSPSLTIDGQFMVFAAFEHADGGKGRTDLYSARKSAGRWTDVKNLSSLNSTSWDSQPTISSDGSIILFSSDRSGNADIFMARKTSTGWSAPQPVSFNSQADDMTPFIGVDNATVYFSSNRSGGMGGFDVYVSKMSGSSFSVPSLLPVPVNSASDEFSYVAVTNSDQAFVSSDRPGGEGRLDIYMVTPNPFPASDVAIVQGSVLDAVSNDALGADITVTDLKTGKRVSELRSDDQDGQYSVALLPGRVYSITASREGYLFYSERFEVPPDAKATTLKKELLLSPLSEGDTRLLVFFDFGKFSLQDESIPELERIVEFLKMHPGVRVSFEGHTDDVGDAEPNVTLSRRRAASVVDYVEGAGVAKERLSSVGFGEERPKIPVRSLSGSELNAARAQNRRVEMKIVK